MRTLPAVITLGVVTPLLSAIPVMTMPGPEPKPVPSRVHTVPLRGVDAAAVDDVQPGGEPVVTGPRARGDRVTVALTTARATTRFELVGVSWEPDAAAGDPTVWVRTRTGGRWSGWRALGYDAGHAPDPGSEEAVGTRDGTDPFWAGPSDGVQVRVDTRGGVRLPDLRADLVDPGTSAADADPALSRPAASADAAAAKPTIYSRAQWGADESIRECCPRYGTTIKVGWVHHTVNSNSYTSSDVPKIIRSIYAYHVLTRGWSDIGYNFLIDKYGRTWEGRYGGVAKPVIGAHTYPYNTNTFGVSGIGNYETANPTSAMVDSFARLEAWKLGLYNVDPYATSTMWDGKKFAAISGHRNAAQTACPGDYLYAKLSTIRSKARSYGTTVALVSPSVSPTRVTAGSGTKVVVSSGVTTTQSWRLDVIDPCSGLRLRSYSGTASPSTPIRVAWDLKDRWGYYVPPSGYRLKLSSWTSYATATSYQHSVIVQESDGTYPNCATRLYGSRFGDWDGDGVDSPAWVRGKWWRVRLSGLTSGTDRLFEFGTGESGELPVSGDWNGDGRDDPGVFRNGMWYFRYSTTSGDAQASVSFGRAGDRPVVGDWNGDGRDELGVVRGATWYLKTRSGGGTAEVSFSFGRSTDLPAPGDWDDDGRDEPGLYRTGTWYLQHTLTGGDAVRSFTYGAPTDVPVVGDWDGDHTAEPGVVRGSAQGDTWYLRRWVSSGTTSVWLKEP